MPPLFAYRNPPVHEVILSLQFQQPLAEGDLDGLPAIVGLRFQDHEQLATFETQLGFGPGQRGMSTRMTPDGWLFKDSGGTRVLQTRASAVTLHAVRPGPWPVGPYVGWEAIHLWALDLLSCLAATYGTLGIKRAGLRYLNRIAVPDGTPPSEWFTFTPAAPPILQDLFALEYRGTWASVDGNADLSASVGLARIEVEDPSIAKGNQGFLLDIDVFNLQIPKAPAYQDLNAYFTSAHAMENDIFNSCITQPLRDRFGRLDAPSV